MNGRLVYRLALGVFPLIFIPFNNLEQTIEQFGGPSLRALGFRVAGAGIAALNGKERALHAGENVGKGDAAGLVVSRASKGRDGGLGQSLGRKGFRRQGQGHRARPDGWSPTRCDHEVIYKWLVHT